MNRTTTRRLALAVSAALLAGTMAATSDTAVAAAAAGQGSAASASIERISVGHLGQEASIGEKFPERPAVSAHGRYATYVALSPDLVPGDTNTTDDVFVRDRKADTTIRVSVGPGGRQANDSSGEATISDHGRTVAFTSAASNLAGRDTNDTVDVFVRDLKAGATRLVSVGMNGRAGNGPSFLSDLSATGRYVAFQSLASNLVPGDTNGVEDAFVRDLRTGRTERVSLLGRGQGLIAAGVEPHLSANGRFVLFQGVNSDEDAPLYIRDRVADTTRRLRIGQPGITLASWTISGNGRYVAFTTDAPLVAADTNGEFDAYRHDLATGAIERVSVGSGGRQGNAPSETVDLSWNGRVVAFSSWASNLVAGDTNDVVDVFRRDLHSGTTRRISVGIDGQQANAESAFSRDLAISADGRHAAFASFATNLIPNDRNDQPDIFVWNLRNR
jgi:Tol biopolymer transport system component